VSIKVSKQYSIRRRPLEKPVEKFRVVIAPV
jgi:hypothetical protein